jgi:uncharacterized protein
VRLAIISDTHLPRGGRRIPDACLDRLRDADAILHAGDFIAVSVLRDLEELGPPVHGVRGNVDGPGPASGRLARMRRTFPDADAVVFGHSHLPLHEEAAGFAIFNPGSPTERRRAPHHTMGVATAEGGTVRFELVTLD